jgi:hypothetical protein
MLGLAFSLSGTGEADSIVSVFDRPLYPAGITTLRRGIFRQQRMALNSA